MPHATNNHPRALIIDDEVDICYLLKRILSLKNIEADYVTSISAAQEMLNNHQPSVIFLDNHLGDGLGMDYVRNIKISHPTSKIVMITAHDTFADRELAYLRGVDFFIGKPFSREIILKALEKLEIKS